MLAGDHAVDFTVELYETASGQPVVEEELLGVKSQTPALYALLLAGLNKLRDRAYHGPPFCVSLGDGLFEMRVGREDTARAFWFFRRGRRIVVVRCFVKKSQKTPLRELELARRRMGDYLAREAGDGDGKD